MSDMTRQPVIVGAARTPIGRYLGGLASLSAPELGAIAIRAALQRSGVDPAAVQEVIMGHVLQGGTGQAPARQAMLKAGVPSTASALTVNKVCGSGLKAVMLAAQAIKAGDAQVIVAGGQESMSNAPHYVYGMRGGVRIGDQTMVDGMIKDGLWCGTCDVHMGSHAEYTASKAGRMLDRMLEAIGLTDRVFITNTVFWRPPGNRTPTPEEQLVCKPFVEQAIRLVRPRMLLLVGAPATRCLLDQTEGINRLHGRWFEWRTADGDLEVPALPTFHPAFLMRTPSAKAMAWADLKTFVP